MMVEEEVKADLNSLIGTGLGVAQEQLEAHGGFLPVALVLGDDGGMRMVAVSPEEAAHQAGRDQGAEEPDADAMIDDLYQLLAAQKDANRAAAVVCDIHLPDDATDAVHVVAEHRAGVVISAVAPYTETGGNWTFSEPIWETEEPRIWP
ncbi:MAG TPA: hypothetical protein VGN49_00280 [Micrococcaceae bacterium]|nr:hypothetical protein [Micrococcaceae bacterium]